MQAETDNRVPVRSGRVTCRGRSVPSDPSEAIPGATSAYRTPTFGASSYSFGVPEDAATTTLVGSVSATDPNDDAVTHTITTGNEDVKFDIATSTGAITVAAALDYETTPSYTLAVEASAGRGNSATATVEIEVTDVFGEITSASENVAASLSAGTFTITWDTVTGAANYEVQYRSGGSGGTWASVHTSTTTTLTYSSNGRGRVRYDVRVQSARLRRRNELRCRLGRAVAARAIHD